MSILGRKKRSPLQGGSKNEPFSISGRIGSKAPEDLAAGAPRIAGTPTGAERLAARPTGRYFDVLAPVLEASRQQSSSYVARWSLAEFRRPAPGSLCRYFRIEACASLANMLDKRARFAPSTHSLLAVCPVPWLLAPVVPGGDVPRWKATGLLEKEPTTPLVLPVRDIRVLYALKARHYKGFVESQVPYPHEYFMPMEALIAENSHQNPALQTLLARASASANFLELT